jgi:hypothetical protein
MMNKQRDLFMMQSSMALIFALKLRAFNDFHRIRIH